MRTIDKVRRALDFDFTVADAYVAVIALVGVIGSLIGLLAIGGGR